MKLTPFTFKWMMNLYPPMLFNRIVVKRVSADFKEVDVVIKKSLFNKNLQGTIFGGTLFSAADPFFSMMYWQVFTQRGLKMEAWIRAAEADYKKPCKSDMSLKFRITEQDVEDARQMVEKEGRIKKWHLIQMTDRNNEVCVEVKLLVYIHHVKRSEEQKGVF